MHYVYILHNINEEIYIGCTSDLRKRISLHNSGKVQSTKNNHWELVFYEAYKSKDDAFEREKRLKYHGQAKAQLKRRIKRSLGCTQH